MTSIGTTYHHGSHRHLLTPIPAANTDTNIDAIVVPAARQASSLWPAIHLAEQLHCHVLAVCTYDGAAKEAGKLSERVIGVDFETASLSLRLLESDHQLANNKRTFAKDTGTRRNLGLLIGRAMNWKRVVFLDDDLTDLDRRDAQNAAAHLDDFDAIGMQNRGHPDNSVLCHTRAQMNHAQDQFIGGGAVVVNPSQTRSFFPRIYCEDWLFFIGDALRRGDTLPRLGVTGSIRQAHFDPYAIEGRAAEEEFGDLFAEGLFWLLDEGRPLTNVAFSDTHWNGVLERREALFREVLGSLRMHIPDDAKRFEQVEMELLGARDVLHSVTAADCVAYFEAWWNDLTTTWPRMINAVEGAYTRPAATVDEALERIRRA